jgi:hypothetical protein
MQRNFIEIQKAPSHNSQRAESPLDTLLSNSPGSLEEKKTITTKPFRKKRPEKRRHQSLLSLRLLRQHLFQQQQQQQQQQEQFQSSSSDVFMGDLSFEQTIFGEPPSPQQDFKVLPLFSINQQQDNFVNQFQQDTSGHFEVKKEDLNALLMEGMVTTQQNGIPILFDNRNQQDSFPNSFNGPSHFQQQQDNLGNFRVDSPELNFLRNEDLILTGRKRSSSAPPNGVQKPMSPLRGTSGSKGRRGSKRGRKPKVYDDMVLKFKLQ